MHLAEEESPQRKSECIQVTDVEREGETRDIARRDGAKGVGGSEKEKSLYPAFTDHRGEGAEV